MSLRDDSEVGDGYGAPSEKELREAKAAAQAEAAAQWPPLVEFDAELSGPPLPLDALPPVLRGFVEESAASTQVPPGLAFAPTLAVIAAAAARRAQVKVGSTHVEPLNLYVGAIAASGERKGPPLRAALKPLEEAERDLCERLADRLAENRQERAIAEKRIAHLQALAAKCDDAQERAQLRREAQRVERETPAELLQPQLVIDDATPEATVRALAEQGGKLAMFSEEAGTFVGNASGRYDKSGAPNLDAVLKAYDGGMIRVNRVSRAATHVEQPALTVGVMLQPELIDRIGETPELRGRGLLARFAWVWPESLVGDRDYQDRAISEQTRCAYHRMVRALLALPAADSANAPLSLRIEADALRLWADYQNELERDQRDGGRLASVRDWAGKHAGRVARVAGLWHLARHAGGPIPEAIEVSAVEDAIRLGRWLVNHALVVFARLGTDPATAECKRILAWVRSERREQFTRRELHQARYRDRLRPEELDPYLGALESRGFIRKLADAPRPTGGRRSAAYAVNPGLSTHRQNPQNPQNSAGREGSEGFEGFDGEGSSEKRQRRSKPEGEDMPPRARMDAAGLTGKTGVTGECPAPAPPAADRSNYPVNPVYPVPPVAGAHTPSRGGEVRERDAKPSLVTEGEDMPPEPAWMQQALDEERAMGFEPRAPGIAPRLPAGWLQ